MSKKKKVTFLCKCFKRAGWPPDRGEAICHPVGDGILPSFAIPDKLMEAAGRPAIAKGSRFLLTIDISAARCKALEKEFDKKEAAEAKR